MSHKTCLGPVGPGEKVNVFVTVPMPDECVKLMTDVDPRVNVIFDKDLIPDQRYPADRRGQAMEWTPERDRKWNEYLKEADILFGFDYRHMDNLRDFAPKLKWVQGTSTGIGPSVVKAGWPEKGIVATTASGIHSVPISEFVIMSMLCFEKDIFHLFDLKSQRKHERYCTGQLRGKTLGIVGLGKNGRLVATLAAAHGMRVLATKRTTQGYVPQNLGVDQLYAPADIKKMLPQCDYVSMTVPTTPDTYKMMDYEMFKTMKPGAVFINNSMGTTVVQDDLIRAIKEGHLRGAAIDVYEKEPVPADSPLWSMPNVLMSPHSASCCMYEDANIANLFIDNLRRYLDGRPLRNAVRPELQY